MPVPPCTDHGLTLAQVAAASRSDPVYRNWAVRRIATGFPDDSWCIAWINQAQEAGYDVGMPLDPGPDE